MRRLQSAATGAVLAEALRVSSEPSGRLDLTADTSYGEDLHHRSDASGRHPKAASTYRGVIIHVAHPKQAVFFPDPVDSATVTSS